MGGVCGVGSYGIRVGMGAVRLGKFGLVVGVCSAFAQFSLQVGAELDLLAELVDGAVVDKDKIVVVGV